MANTVYGVTYSGGSSGQFIKSMLVYILKNDTVDMNFEDATCHSYYADYLKTHPYGKLLSPLSADKFSEKYQYLIRKTDLPLVETPVLPISLRKIRNNVDYKLLYINFTICDLPVIISNHYYKQPKTKPFYFKLANKLFSVSDMSQVSREQEKILINHPDNLSSYIRYYNHLAPILVDDPEDVYCINFSDIINNANKVKQTLETVTNVQMSIHAHRQYDRYIERQLQFRTEKEF